MNSLSINIDFYQNIGKLFYAIASSDKNVRKEEFNKLNESIKDNWLKMNSPEGRNEDYTVYQIEFMFNALHNSKSNPEVSFNEFLNFKKENESLFTDQLKKLIWDTANKISLAVAGNNKSELIMLTRLKINLLK